MNAFNLKRDGNKLSVCLFANGYNWAFELSRATDADAANLFTLLNQASASSEKLNREMRESNNSLIERLERSNRSLRVCLTKLKAKKP